MIFVKWVLLVILGAACFAFCGAALLALADPEGRGGKIAGRFLTASLILFVAAVAAAMFWDV